MNILAELLEFLFTPDVAPETPRGWLILSLIYGLVVTCVLGYMLLDSPFTADAAIVLAFIGAPLGLIFSALHFVREPSDRLLSLSTFAVNAIAVVLALVVLAA